MGTFCPKYQIQCWDICEMPPKHFKHCGEDGKVAIRRMEGVVDSALQ